jgi:hypothetical protein
VEGTWGSNAAVGLCHGSCNSRGGCGNIGHSHVCLIVSVESVWGGDCSSEPVSQVVRACVTACVALVKREQGSTPHILFTQTATQGHSHRVVALLHPAA